MSNHEPNSSEEGRIISTAVAIDKDKNSQFAVKWAIDRLKLKDNRIILVHVKTQQDVSKEGREPTQQLFLPYRGFCARKGIRVKEVILQDVDVANALCEYISFNSITTIVLGASSRGALARAFKNTDIPSTVGKYAPDSCAVYAVSKGKVVKLKSSSSQPDTPSSATSSMPQNALSLDSPSPAKYRLEYQPITPRERPSGSKTPSPQNSVNSNEFLQTVPGEKRNGSKNPTPLDSANTSYESIVFGSSYSSSQYSGAGDSEFGHMTPPNRQPGSKISAVLQSMNNLNLQEIEDELRRLKQELKQITVKYNVACQETVTARDKVRGIVQWKSEEGNKLEEAKHAQETALAIVEREKLMCKAAVEVAHKAQRIAELESEKRKHAEMKFKQESEEKQKAIDALAHSEIRYRRYTMDEIEVATNYFSGSEKIAILDHTPVAIKVLRPDMSQGEKQFQREVEVLSRMRHPHMVILLGACPEYGCLVYEYMENGSLEDRLYRKDGTCTLSWSTRFRIAAEIATALNFLHRTRPEPLVHRDLKPANILLDKNYVSKISDVGLSRLVPPDIADSVTQYRMTAAAGTFCYIDPEYQQTGMLGTKSDIYSLGVMLLQIITAKTAMGLTHHVETAIETGQFAEILDQTVKDWPVEEALSLAKLALKCCELRRKDRPDLDSVILPELERLRDLGSPIKPEGRFYHTHSQSRMDKFYKQTLIYPDSRIYRGQ
ncbi:hypothetical protein Pfo_012256 [Paulownia fortunei]|nr:hypothetical protein Pfo_012256 [Paulownia fortunei]